ncbi:MAG: cysteine hydrolase [Defluviitaleaceae bacterium]|nr:cysteine hydrolase [Defluviitaleaceae bacterium]
MYKVLIIVDMQKDFIDGALGTAEAAAIVDGVVRRVTKSDGEMILFTQDTHHDDYLQTPEGKKLPVPHCIEGSDGWRIDQRIVDAWRNNTNTITASELCDNTFTKPVFGSVRLVEFLSARRKEIDGIELLGLCTDICVVSNAIMLKNNLPEVAVSVNEACCAGVTPASHSEAINTMRMCHIDIV